MATSFVIEAWCQINAGERAGGFTHSDGRSAGRAQRAAPLQVAGKNFREKGLTGERVFYDNAGGLEHLY
jgi:hypothetical protein